MKNISKQLEVLVTNFKSDQFLQARRKLTIFYTSAVFIILFIFSLAVYGLFSKNIKGNLEFEGTDQEEDINIEMQVIDRAEDQLQVILIGIDALIIILIGGFSYYLASKTLKPIESTYVKQKKFIADAAHELRTPLAVIKTGSEAVLSGSESNKEYRKLVKDSLEEVDFMSIMVNDLLFLARSDDVKKVEFLKLDLSLLCLKESNIMDSYANDKNVTIHTDIQEGLYIKGNKADIKRLLANIIKNAIDYNKPKGSVVVSLKKIKNQIELKVVDTGIGIMKEDLNNIFDRFYKVDKSRVKQSGGAGLGLSIAQEIIKFHKGDIDIKSNINKGTEVQILLPRII